ncbi:hypothetical protein ACOZWC_003506, partial [Cronobacter turicensis]
AIQLALVQLFSTSSLFLIFLGTSPMYKSPRRKGPLPNSDHRCTLLTCVKSFLACRANQAPVNPYCGSPRGVPACSGRGARADDHTSSNYKGRVCGLQSAGVVASFGSFHKIYSGQVWRRDAA